MRVDTHRHTQTLTHTLTHTHTQTKHTEKKNRYLIRDEIHNAVFYIRLEKKTQFREFQNEKSNFDA